VVTVWKQVMCAVCMFPSVYTFNCCVVSFRAHSAVAAWITLASLKHQSITNVQIRWSDVTKFSIYGRQVHDAVF